MIWFTEFLAFDEVQVARQRQNLTLNYFVAFLCDESEFEVEK